MKRIFVILTAAAAVILSGCHKEITDAINDMNNTKVDFTYSVSGMTVSFTPQCDTKVTGFEWFFGDEGSTKIPYPSHTFKTAGTHKVHLTGTWYTDGKLRTKDCMHEVTVKSSGEGGGGTQQDPKAYLTGFAIHDIPYSSATLRLTCNVYSVNGDVITTTTQNIDITKSSLIDNPYIYTLSTPKYIATAEELYYSYSAVELIVKRLYNGGWSEIYRGSEVIIKRDQKEYFYMNDDANLEISIYFDYK